MKVTSTILTHADVSIHSRAARRGEEPPAKDLVVKSAATETDYKPWMHSAQSAGIGKKKKPKPLTRQQKVRAQKALEKADVNVDKLERKVADSKARARRVQGRRKDWDELNAKVEGRQGGKAASVSAKAGGAEEMEVVEAANAGSRTPMDSDAAPLDGAPTEEQGWEDVPDVEEDVDEVT